MKEEQHKNTDNNGCDDPYDDKYYVFYILLMIDNILINDILIFINDILFYILISMYISFHLLTLG